MFRTTATIDRLTIELARAQGELRANERTLTALETTMDWMRTRLTQLEHERAMLIQNYMGITIKVPTVEKQHTPSPHVNPLFAAPNFEDVGEDEAARMGISHNPDGTLRYTPPGGLVNQDDLSVFTS